MSELEFSIVKKRKLLLPIQEVITLTVLLILIYAVSLLFNSAVIKTIPPTKRPISPTNFTHHMEIHGISGIG